jgi:hypothetical protein
VTCSRCGQPLGLITYTLTAWAGETILAEATLCPVCGHGLTSPTATPEHYPITPQLGP